jgi:hypothetical protein
MQMLDTLLMNGTTSRMKNATQQITVECAEANRQRSGPCGHFDPMPDVSYCSETMIRSASDF